MRRDYEQVVESWTPHFIRRTVDWAGRGHIGYRRLVLPLSSDGARVDMLLGLTEEARSD
ncbi:MAG: hypothetical protein RIB45_05225 [Marivibrio sp.]|uniref:hypothetical protein n=1 Tax=Marivibrio sp. TaxID=2039719 RepID=UPI0032F05C1E